MRLLKVLAGMAAAGALLLAQHNYTPQDVEDGGRLFRANCVGCHGPNGDLVPGVDLGHGKFKRATTDADIAGIIRNGIPGTPMPPSNFTEFQAETIVAYLRSLAISSAAGAPAGGDAARGKAIFEGKGSCTTCHRVDGRGSRVGPDLSDIGALRQPANLQQSLLDPDAEILPETRSVRAVTRDGKTITGRILTEDTFTLQLIDSSEHLMALNKANLREYEFLKHSPMPSYRGRLSSRELADLVSYLASLKGVIPQ